MRQSVETGRAQLELTKQNLKRQQDLWNQQLTTRELLDKALNDVKVAESGLSERQKLADAQASRIAQERANLDSAQYDLSKVRIVSPIDGIVTARTIQEGEMVMIGTMNNAGTVLMTLADMSIIQAEIEVDETNVPNVQLGQTAKITHRRDPRQVVQRARRRDRQQPNRRPQPARPAPRPPTSRSR